MSSSSSSSELVARRPQPKKKRKHVGVQVEGLPKATSYTRSYRGLRASSLAVHSKQGLIALGTHTGSVELRQHGSGDLQLIRRLEAFSSTIRQVQFSCDGTLLAFCTCAGSVGVVNTQTADIVALQDTPGDNDSGELVRSYLTWTAADRLVVARGTCVRVYTASLELIRELSDLHKNEISGVKFSAHYDCMLSWDSNGLVEVWDEAGLKPESLRFKTKSETDLFYFRKLKRHVRDIAVSEDKFAVLDTDGRLVLYDLATCRRRKEYDESLTTLEEIHKLGMGPSLEPADFAARKAAETRDGDAVVFDVSSSMLIYPTLFGIKALSIANSTVVRLYGLVDAVRFHQVGVLQRAGQLTADTAAAENKLVDQRAKSEALLVALDAAGTVFVFANDIAKPRDVDLAQSASRAGASVSAASPVSPPAVLDSTAILHTSMGDIGVDLFAEQAASAVEAFLANCREGLYDRAQIRVMLGGLEVQPTSSTDRSRPIWSTAPSGTQLTDEMYVLSSPTGPSDKLRFFLTTKGTESLDTPNSAFGKVHTGFDVLAAIAEAGSRGNHTILVSITLQGK